jgi:hypothetical protein
MRLRGTLSLQRALGPAAHFPFIRVCIAAALLGSMAACVDKTHNGLIFDPAKVAQIQPGKSTMADVVALFGKPPALVTQYDGRKFASYTASDTTSMMIPESVMSRGKGTPLPGNGDPILLPAMAAITGGGVRLELYAPDVQVLDIHYSTRDIVDDYRLDDCDRRSCHPVDMPSAPKP